jgi:tetratricopeptide (TPR) repeat protein
LSEPRAFLRNFFRFGAVALLCSLPAVPARAELPRAFDLASTSSSGNYLAARIAGAGSDMASASAYYRAALRADPTNPDLVERTFLVTLASGAVEESLILAEQVIQFDKNHRIARLALGAKGIKTGQFAQARTHLALAVRGPIADLTSTLLTGWAFYGSNNITGATAHIDKLSGPDWYAVFKDLHAGLILDLGKQSKEALRRIDRVRALDPNSLRTIDTYGRMLSRAGRADDALKVYNDFSLVLARHPLVVSAVTELKAGKRLAPLAKNASEGAAEALFGLGTALGRQGGADLGLIYLQLAIYLAPEHPLAVLAVGDLYETLKKYQLAIDAYERVPQSSPLRRNAEIQSALNLEILEKKDEARERLLALVKEKPDDIEGQTALANVMRAGKRYPDAAEIYTRVISMAGEIKREHWTLFYFRGICYERSKQWALAEKDFQKALELFPDQPQVLNYLGYSWVDQGVNLDQALDMIRKAVALRPNDGYIVDSLGWAYYRLGRLAEATVELERAIELRPEDPTINDHLGDVYWKTDRKLEAKFQWSHARDLKPEPEELPKIEQKLKEGLVEETTPRAGEIKDPNKG